MRATCAPAPVRLLRSPINERVPISHQPSAISELSACIRSTYGRIRPFASATLDVLFPISVIVNWNRGIANALLTQAPSEVGLISSIFFSSFVNFLTERTISIYLFSTFLFYGVDRFGFREVSTCAGDMTEQPQAGFSSTSNTCP